MFLKARVYIVSERDRATFIIMTKLAMLCGRYLRIWFVCIFIVICILKINYCSNSIKNLEMHHTCDALLITVIRSD